ncbi:hypothetical protein JXB37_07335 [candidate division WOR-3 bacterium]|nr:hypothetical protein [candidate division WOR-3 bacterium]
MKHNVRFLPLALGAALFLFLFVGGDSGCNSLTRDDRIEMAAWVTGQPQGGSGVNTVSCTFEASFSRTDGETDPIDPPARIFTTWYSPHGNYNHETHELSNPTRVHTFTVSKSAPQGAHLDKPFWLVISWYDTDDRNEITSDTAYCE